MPNECGVLQKMPTEWKKGRPKDPTVLSEGPSGTGGFMLASTICDFISSRASSQLCGITGKRLQGEAGVELDEVRKIWNHQSIRKVPENEAIPKSNHSSTLNPSVQNNAWISKNIQVQIRTPPLRH